MADGQTQYGFTWGPIIVERCTQITTVRGARRVLRIHTGSPSQDLNIYVSPSGRSVRIFRGGQELKAERR